MITEVKLFLQNFFEAELNAHNAGNIPDLENYNKKIDKMYSFCHEDLGQILGIMKKDKLEDDSYYEEWKDFSFQYPRVLFKISQYKNQRIGDIYIAYVSKSAMNSNFFVVYHHAFIIRRINDDYKIIGIYFIKSENPNNIHWVQKDSIEADLTFANIGDLIAVERYKEPDVDEEYEPELSEFCLKEHKADK